MLPKTRIPDISPLTFCRQIKSAYTGMSLESVECLESERGIFKEYCSILSRELDVPFKTVQIKWGPGIKFPQMPERTRNMLKFVLIARLYELKRNFVA